MCVLIVWSTLIRFRLHPLNQKRKSFAADQRQELPLAYHFALGGLIRRCGHFGVIVIE
jgi:hypothetical protein